jgi:asparagine synthase (glutamine-hydrolysing)
MDHHGFASFSLVYDGLECDERDLIEEIRATYGFRAHFIPCGDDYGRLQLEPRGFQESPNMGIRELRDALCGAATQAGVRAVLTGDVADACVGGSPLVFDSLLRHGKLRAFWRSFQRYRRTSDESRLKMVALYLLGPLLPLGLQKQLMAACLRRILERNRSRLVPWWVAEPLREEQTRRHIQLRLEAERGRRFSSLAREAEYRLLYPPEVARHPVPWPLEFWRPFADRRLHEFLLAVPSEQKFRPHPETDDFYAGSKWLVRRAMRGILPESIRTRTSKTVFTAALETEIARQWPLYEQAFGPNGTSEIARRGYVDPEQFWSRLQALRNGKQGSDFMYLMQVVGLETWLRTLGLPRPQSVTVEPPKHERLPACPIGSGVVG